MEEQENTIMAYVAGIMDGDGSFSLVRRNEVLNPLFYPMAQLANQNEELIKYFKKLFGGYVYLRKSWIGLDGGKRKDSWQWKLEKSKCKVFLEKVIPFLQIKKQRAEFLITYINNNPFKRGIRLSNECLLGREKSCSTMISLNVEKDMTKQFVSKRRKTSSLEPEFWSYVAGLFDSDGSFSIKRETKRGRKSNTFSSIISLTMTDIRAINFLAKNCPYGRLIKVKALSCKYGICYRFVISNNEEAILFIEKCLPFLRVKKANAEILNTFCKSHQRTRYCRNGVSVEQNLFREKCYQDLVNINYGVYKSTLIDLEVLQQDDKAEDESHRERLNERTSL